MNFKIALALKQAKNTKNASGYGDERICSPVGIIYGTTSYIFGLHEGTITKVVQLNLHETVLLL